MVDLDKAARFRLAKLYDDELNDPDRAVENYRAAQAIAARNLRGRASTEDLRKAVVHYRALFEDLLEVGGTGKGATRTVTERKPEAVQP